MKKFFAALSTTCLLLAITSVPSAPVFAAPALKAATTAEKNAFLKLYAEGDRLSMRRDVAGLGRMMTNNFILQSDGEVINKVQWVRMTTFLMKQTLRVNSARTVVERIGTRKNEAVVVSSSVMDFVAIGPDKKHHRIIGSGQSMDTWVLTKQGWKMKLSQTISHRMTVDGQAVPDGQRNAV